VSAFLVGGVGWWRGREEGTVYGYLVSVVSARRISHPIKCALSKLWWWGPSVGPARLDTT